ncbi:type II toxin-antitoxin system Phd/YefM family antitoxin [Cupriavidus agavae]|uniref:Antitoxin n=1 Tax=Cupriavidus agavae TaxID=1001822 RepID=A0A4Q7RWW4_9BURK|nr:type II toxin-antitoxin system prevent-host-death family antitoxin [Cupriavidus agavae]RZT38414.1 prevent-host-death family protein [Cupriavidus agavae]
MLTVNMHDAKTQLSKLVEAIESGSQEEIIIARNGKPAARLIPMPVGTVSQRIGGGRALLGSQVDDLTLEQFNESDDEIAARFLGDGR